jgi:hypothetical protein
MTIEYENTILKQDLKEARDIANQQFTRANSLEKQLTEMIKQGEALFQKAKTLEIEKQEAYERGYIAGKEVSIATWLDEAGEFLRLEELENNQLNL